MRDKNNNIVVQERCKHCYADSPKAFKNEQSQSLAKCLSEYQTAFKTFQWQPVRQSLKPEQSNMTYGKVRAMMERKSTYGVDYTFNAAPKKVLPNKHKAELKVPNVPMDECSTYHNDFVSKGLQPVPKPTKKDNSTVVISHNPKERFQGDSMYTVSYPAFDDNTISECKQTPIKKKDNMEVPGTGATDGNTQSTAQSDFIYHENVERPMTVRPVENTARPTDPLEERTEYKDFFTCKTQDKHVCKKNVLAKSDIGRFMGVTTAMADFTIPDHFQQPKSCRPEATYQKTPDKFNGLTTSTMAYKPWPVKQYELPVWAKKPTYKRPLGGMIVNSLYMHDFTDPKVICPPSPIVASKKTDDLIKQDRGDSKYEISTTYNKEFKVWSNFNPPQSYRINEVYKTPSEKMVCETNQRSHFRGAPAEKIKPCRHESMHRGLNTDNTMTFITTYSENFISPRPLSSPCLAPNPSVASSPRCASATANMSKTASIPKPDLSVQPTANVLKVGTDDKVCGKCRKPASRCEC